MTDRNLTEEQARALWQRAAELQAEALAAQEERALRPAAEEDAPDADAGASGYPAAVVKKAALEAGISREFVDRALAELGPEADPGGRIDRLADRILGDGPRWATVSRVLDATPSEVYASMQRVLVRAPYQLDLMDMRGGDPTAGGTLVFEVPATAGIGGGSNKAMMDIRHWADMRELHFRLRSVPPASGDDSERTELTIAAPLAYSRRVNFWASSVISGAIGLVGGLVGAGLATATLAPIVGAEIYTALALVLGGGGAATLGTLRSWRALYPRSIERGRRGMERLIQALAVDIQSQGAFLKPTEPASDDDGADHVPGVF
jgi:hypothetical protein